jgi:hypothetical protein
MGDHSRHRREFRSWQAPDVWYVIDRVQEDFPDLRRATIEGAVNRAKGEIEASEGRDKLAEHVRNQLKSTRG